MDFVVIFRLNLFTAKIKTKKGLTVRFRSSDLRRRKPFQPVEDDPFWLQNGPRRRITNWWRYVIADLAME